MTLPNMKLTHWLRDDFPEMLWLCMLCTRYEADGMVMARKVFDTAEEVLKEEFGEMKKVPKEVFVNGRLSSFDTVPEKLRKKIINRLKALSLYDVVFPMEFGVALNRYAGTPAKWIWSEALPSKEPTKDEISSGEKILADTIQSCWSGYKQSSTWAKMAVISAVFSAGRIQIASGVAEEWEGLLPKYPSGLTIDQRKRIEASMRAMYQAVVLAPINGDVKLEWPKDFWQSNWGLYDCAFDEEASSASVKETKAIERFAEEISKRLKNIRDKFKDAATAANPDIYDPTRYEVLSGIVSRVLRASNVAVNTPQMWSTEHGSGLMRSLVEARIVLSWLILKDESTLYEKFKEYGRGHIKLLKLHLEEYLDKQSEPTPELEEYVKNLDNQVNWELSEEFQEIRVDTNFAGNTNSRKMAEETGLLDDYRFVFAPASSAFHGEWPAVDQFALEQCKNPLHKGHKTPRGDDGISLGPQLMELILEQLNDLVERYCAAVDASD